MNKQSNTGLKAVYASNYVRTSGDHKGKTFHVYTIEGSAKDLKVFENSEHFTKYPRWSSEDKKTRKPQIHTLFMDDLYDTVPLYKTFAGGYTLDKSESRKDLARIENLEQRSVTLAGRFADRLADKVFGKTTVSTEVANAFVQEEKKEVVGKSEPDLSKVE